MRGPCRSETRSGESVAELIALSVIAVAAQNTSMAYGRFYHIRGRWLIFVWSGNPTETERLKWNPALFNDCNCRTT